MANSPVETKVKASSALTYLVSLAGLAVLSGVTDTPSVIGFLPDVLEPFALSLVPASAAAIAGWAAPHTPRTIPLRRRETGAYGPDA